MPTKSTTEFATALEELVRRYAPLITSTEILGALEMVKVHFAMARISRVYREMEEEQDPSEAWKRRASEDEEPPAART